MYIHTECGCAAVLELNVCVEFAMKLSISKKIKGLRGNLSGMAIFFLQGGLGD